jgi:hypothetical protein
MAYIHHELQPVVAGGLGHYRDHSGARCEGLVDF